MWISAGASDRVSSFIHSGFLHKSQWNFLEIASHLFQSHYPLLDCQCPSVKTKFPVNPAMFCRVRLPLVSDLISPSYPPVLHPHHPLSVPPHHLFPVFLLPGSPPLNPFHLELPLTLLSSGQISLLLGAVCCHSLPRCQPCLYHQPHYRRSSPPALSVVSVIIWLMPNPKRGSQLHRRMSRNLVGQGLWGRILDPFFQIPSACKSD